MNYELSQTADGSNTIFVPSLNEHYHSVKGALTESLHIFINKGLNASKAIQPRILEIGFGTGLNALLTFIEAEKGRTIHYTTLERYPLTPEIVAEMEYPQIIAKANNESGNDGDNGIYDEKDLADMFNRIHHVKWGEWEGISEHFNLRKIETDFTTYDFEDIYDIVYFDAFAPEKQPEMWSQELFNTLYEHLAPEGILVTYCAKGVVRRMLQNAGFVVERLEGPPGGKREILRAIRK